MSELTSHSRKMTSPNYGVIVIGGGIIGSACSYYAADRGYRTLLLEKFELRHSEGSSGGATRGLRENYSKDFYIPMVRESLRLWQELERQGKETNIRNKTAEIFKKTGLVLLLKKNAASVQQQMMERGIQHRTINSNEDYPMFAGFGEDYVKILEENAGVLNVDEALRCFHERFQELGGIIEAETEVLKIGQTANHVNVTTNKGAYTANHVILACGPWTNQILKSLNLRLPLKIEQIGVSYWKNKISSLSSPMPNFWHESTDYSTNFFSTFDQVYPGHVKICAHAGIDATDKYDVTKSTDHTADDKIHDDVITPEIARFIRDHFPDLESRPAVSEWCRYTLTPDDDYILDKHPQYDRIFIAAGFSGHGFKMAPLVGRLLVELLSGEQPSFDLSPFSIKRFKHTMPGYCWCGSFEK